MELYIGCDIGSISVNRAIFDQQNKIIDILPYKRHLGEPLKIIKNDLKWLWGKFKNDSFKGIALTGSGAKGISRILGVDFINEIEAISSSVKLLHSQINTMH